VSRRIACSTRLALAALPLLAGVTSARAGEPARPRQAVDFAREVYPLLRSACFECHGPNKRRGGLRLDVRAAALAGGDGGKVIAPGQAGKSELLRRLLLPRGSKGAMPAGGEPLTRAQTDLVRDWIDQGARWPDGVKLGPHWAYVKPVRATPPAVRDTAWPRSPVDRFILARLEKEGLRPAPEADRATLLRRVSLDLTGLPPTPAEVDAFVADPSPDAYEKVVERLLASPHFGERWARPWLDLARYADSHGFQRDDLRPLWPYRDWVIRALNADLPFDRFTLEQLAGDLLPGATREQKIATGFHRSAPTNVEAGSEPEETRVNQVFDRVNTTATVWLGTTLECAQCHDHKYDPFSQKDYYRLFAFFNNTAVEADRAKPDVPGSIRFLGPYLTFPGPSAGAGRKAGPVRTLVMQELPAPRKTTVFARGDYRAPGEAVRPGAPAVLPRLPDGPLNRLMLARWLVDRDNPLVARVTVNRWWAELFGRGIVATLEDFGAKGGPPTHPELLDWLAVELMDGGWSMKKVLRTVVLSATYRQSSRLTPLLRARDDQNKLYARGPRFRMDAEMIRDNALTAAGLLSRQAYGPPVQPYQPDGLWVKIGGDKVEYVISPGADRYRRGVYVVWKRAAPYPSLVAFDATARLTCTVKRSRTNTPLQALTLLNDPVYVEAAMALALRVVTETPKADVDERARHAFRLCLAREPRDVERKALRKLYEAQREADRSNLPKVRELFATFPVPPDVPLEELAAWYAVATALLNLDETITKG
jgi:mono/diheme cytochrome c family protein